MQRVRIMKMCLIFGIFVLLISTLLRAASFNCAKAITPQEKAICSDNDLSNQDSEMALRYRKALTQVSTNAKAQMRQDQQGWLSWLATVCNVSFSRDVSALSGCMSGPYKDRIDLLKNAVTVKGNVLFYTRSNYLAGKDGSEIHDAPSAIFNGWGTLIITWELADSPDWSSWNAFVTQRVMKSIVNGRSDKPQSSDASGADSALDASVPSISKELLSTSLSINSMGHGAAHPGERTWMIHWLRAQRRELQTSDVFRKNTPWGTALALSCWKSLKQQFPDEDSLFIKSPHDKELLKVVEDSSNWTFTPEGLSISFPEYSVTPRVSPVDDILVHWKDLKLYVQPDFQPQVFTSKERRADRW